LTLETLNELLKKISCNFSKIKENFLFQFKIRKDYRNWTLAHLKKIFYQSKGFWPFWRIKKKKKLKQMGLNLLEFGSLGPLKFLN